MFVAYECLRPLLGIEEGKKGESSLENVHLDLRRTQRSRAVQWELRIAIPCQGFGFGVNAAGVFCPLVFSDGRFLCNATTPYIRSLPISLEICGERHRRPNPHSPRSRSPPDPGGA